MTKKYLFPLILVVAFGVSFSAFAVDPTPTPTPSPTSTPTPSHSPRPSKSPKPIPKPEDVVCIQNAIEKRDNAIFSAIDQYAISWKTALMARKTALKAAMSLTDKKQRHEAVKNTQSDYRKAKKLANKTYDMAANDAWKQYKKDVKPCGGKMENGSNEEGDN